MKNLKYFVFGLVSLSLFLVGVNFAAAAVCINCQSGDYPIFQMKNRTQNPSVWTTGSMNAAYGDNLGFLVWFKNSGDTTAQNGKVRVVVPKNSQLSPISVKGELAYSNGGPTGNSGNVVFSGTQPAKLVFESQARYYVDNSGNYTTVPVTIYESGNDRIIEFNVGSVAANGGCGQLYFFANLVPDQQQILPTVDIKANGSDGPVSLTSLANYTLSWVSANAMACTASGAWSGSKAINGSESYSSVGQGSYTYVINCSNQYGSASDTVIVNVSQQQILPTVDIKVNGSDGTITLNSPAYYTLNWTSNNANTCSASSSWSGSKSINGSESSFNVGQGNYTYTITCSNQYGSANDSVGVNVIGQNTQGVLSVSKLARDPAITTSVTYYENLYMIPSREVEFSIAVTNTGSTQIGNLYVQDSLPAGMTYVSGSTAIEGVLTSDGIVSGGIYAGTILAGQSKTIKFRARLQDNVYFTQSLTQMTNTAYARGDNASQVQDTANIFAVKQGQVLGAATVDTGADGNTLAVLFSGLGAALSLSGFQVSRRIYWKKRIREVRLTND